MTILLAIEVSIIGSWILGGQIKGRLRDVPVPILMGIGIWFATKSWIAGILSMATFQAIRLGYGNYSPENDPKPSFLASITHDRNGWWIRAIYGLIVALVGCGALFALKLLPLPKAIGYITGNALIGFCVSRFRLPVLITDILVSAGFGSLILLI